MDDLVKRLRDRRVCSLAQNSCRNDWVCEQAADRIEELEAKLAKAVEALGRIADDCGADYPPSHGAIKHDARTTITELKGL